MDERLFGAPRLPLITLLLASCHPSPSYQPFTHQPPPHPPPPHPTGPTTPRAHGNPKPPPPDGPQGAAGATTPTHGSPTPPRPHLRRRGTARARTRTGSTHPVKHDRGRVGRWRGTRPSAAAPPRRRRRPRPRRGRCGRCGVGGGGRGRGWLRLARGVPTCVLDGRVPGSSWRGKWTGVGKGMRGAPASARGRGSRVRSEAV
jgi:hypothetical protein